MTPEVAVSRRCTKPASSEEPPAATHSGKRAARKLAIGVAVGGAQGVTRAARRLVESHEARILGEHGHRGIGLGDELHGQWGEQLDFDDSLSADHVALA